MDPKQNTLIEDDSRLYTLDEYLAEKRSRAKTQSELEAIALEEKRWLNIVSNPLPMPEQSEEEEGDYQMSNGFEFMDDGDIVHSEDEAIESPAAKSQVGS